MRNISNILIMYRRYTGKNKQMFIDFFGKIRFIGINPAYYLIDKEEKKVTRKNLDHFLTDESDMFSFDKLES
ncbi:hypothetical protein [Flavobacterium sp. N2038]|uniref:hypothetical protein n=1 Tax=Flavobacterium sp. N2038 TaxID=2986829 RepID=UPI00222568F0|nr:hypothetical protein [Flavobacterium sp. N2038]